MSSFADVSRRAAKVRLLCLDVDGVLTEGGLFYGATGEAFKRYHVRDGLGIVLLQHHGIEVAIVSARASEIVKVRMADLKVRHWFVGRQDKSAALDELLASLKLTVDQVAYLGDDLLDLPVMRRVGLAVAVRDAHPCALAAAHHRTEAIGGQGAVRELADLLLDSQLGLEAAYEAFLANDARPRAVEKA